MNTPKKTKALLLVNLGTPGAPTKKIVAKYLKQFLMDRHVITLPFVFRWILVNCIIVPFRSKSSAINYKRIWNTKGSPLSYHTKDLARVLSEVLHKWGTVDWAMRYAEPSVKSTIQKMMNTDHNSAMDELYILPLYPQFAYSTTETALEHAFQAISELNFKGAVFYKNSFYSDPNYLKVMSRKIKSALEKKPGSHLLFSFHGLPESHLKQKYKNCFEFNCCENQRDDRGCYRAQCLQTAHLLAETCGLSASEYSTSFQSRLGLKKWLSPYSVDKVADLCRNGVQSLIVAAPSFTADCLETVDELDRELRQVFESLGGKYFELVPALNSDHDWACALEKMLRFSSGDGWVRLEVPQVK